MKNFKVEWTGGNWSLCIGRWKLYIDGEDKSNLIPEELRDGHMNTVGTYRRWYFDNWEEVWESYNDGLDCVNWINVNDYWLTSITNDYKEKVELFKEFQTQDFRPCSCGGCI